MSLTRIILFYVSVLKLQVYKGNIYMKYRSEKTGFTVVYNMSRNINMLKILLNQTKWQRFFSFWLPRHFPQ